MIEEFLDEFLIECAENLSQIDNDLLLMEKGEFEVINNIFRAIHTVKGSCGMFGLKRLERLTHAAEDVLGVMREGKLKPDVNVVDKILKSIDLTKSILAEIQKTKTEPEGDDQEVIEELKKLVEHPQPQDHDSTSASLKNVTEVSSTQLVDHSLRVSIDVLDSIMNAVGELVLSRNRLLQLTRSDGQSHFMGPIQHLNRVTTSLQTAVMKTRMRPIGQAWSKLPRIVRDLANHSGKQIEVIMNGQNTEIDRQVLDAIQDPLLHCVRNSADHGIENPEERINSGKNPTGKISLNAYQEGGKIIIEIKDDGAGIHVERVRNKIIERQILTSDQVETLSDDQVIQYIFVPGFSTAEQVTEISGRGVGMDVVKSNIEKINGTIRLESQRGVGTTFKVEIPLTLAIVQALVVVPRKETQQIFTIPQLNILEVVHFDSEVDQLEKINGTRFLNLRNQFFPLIDLGEMLGFSDDPFSFIEEDKKCKIVIVKAGQEKFGLCVYSVSDIYEIVVKPLGQLLQSAQFYSGCTILGDGRVVLILDIPKIFSFYQLNTSSKKKEDDHENENKSSSERVSFLLFRSHGDKIKAVPLALVSRIEEVNQDDIDFVDGSLMMDYQNRLLRLIKCDEFEIKNKCYAIIFSDGAKSMGLVVEKIVDVVEEHINIETGVHQQGVVGAALIKSKKVEVIDTYYYLQKAYPDWFSSSISSRDHAEKMEKKERIKILYAEDSPFFRNLISPFIEANGYEIVTCQDGEEAFTKLENGLQVDLVLSDIEMPNLDGFSLVKKIKSQWSDLPVIALTTLSSEKDRNKGKEAGFDDYLIKFDQDLLLQSIKLQLEKKVLS